MNSNRHERDSSQEENSLTSPPLSQYSDSSKLAATEPGIASHTDNIKDRNSRSEFRWSKVARDLVRANMNASGSEVSLLISRLVAESGNPRWACRRFVRSMGVQARRPYRMWSEQEQQRLLKLIDLHPVNEIARLMRRSQSSIWHMLQRMGANAKMGKDNFTVYTLAEALHVRPEKIQEWISRGWLKARQVETGKAVRVIIEAEDFCDFCRKHTRDVVGNRLTEERLDFVYHFVFPPSHAGLLPVRESRKERNAYGAQLEEAGNQRFGPDVSSEGREVLDRIA